METATHLPSEPDDLDDSLGAGDPQSPEGPITGVKTVRGMKESGSKFSGLFGSDSSDDEDEDENDEEATSKGDDRPGIDRPSGIIEGTYGQDSSGVGRRNSQKGRRPSTTEAKERQPLSDEDEDIAAAEQMEQLRINETHGSFTYPDDDSSDDDMVEIRPRRTS